MLKAKFVPIIVLAAFLANTFGPLPLAQADDFHLPAPGVMVHLSPPLDPPILKGIKVHPDNPFRFDFILDKGDSSVIPAKAGIQQQEQLKQQSIKLVKYFLASLTIPEKDLWVNLSPYEKDRIIPQSFGLTEMGRDLLAEDYMLKQITASLIYPEGEVGKKFWKRIYVEAARKFGTTNIPVNTFNKVWIVPQKAVVYENAKAGTAYVVESKLKVMLEEDYLSLSKHVSLRGGEADEAIFKRTIASQILREIVIPQLTKEVNEDKNFAQLRQVYNSLILATWYKKKIKDSILGQVYENKNKVVGINIDDPQEKEKIYQQYLKAFKKGVYNYIKEEQDPVRHEVIPRKYFSGGVQLDLTIKADAAMKIITHLEPSQIVSGEPMYQVTSDFAQASLLHLMEKINDKAMAANDKKLQWQHFIAPTDDRQLLGRTVALPKEKAFELGDLVDLSQGLFQQSFVFPGETRGKKRSHIMGYGVTNIHCIAITYDKYGHVIGLMFKGQHPQEGEVSAYWQLKDGQWQGEKQDKVASWKAFIKPTTDDSLKGRTVELPKEEAFELGNLVAVSGGQFQQSFVFPGETQGKQRSHTMGKGVSDIHCTAIKYDKEGQVSGLMFKGRHPKEGEVSAYWQLKDGQWVNEKQDKVTSWKAFIQPTVDDSLKGRTVELPKEKAFELGDLVAASPGRFQKSFIFPGETEGKPRPHTMGTYVSDIRCTAIKYDKEGQVVGLMFKGQHPKEGEVSAYWQLKDGQWHGEKQDKVASWKAFIQATTDGSLKGRTVELFKEGAFELDDLVAVSRGEFQISFTFPGETEGKSRPHTLGKGVSDIRCTAIKYDKEGQVVGLMFKGQHPKEGEVSAYWQLKDGQWQGEKQDKVASWKAFIKPTTDDSLKGRTVELPKEEAFELGDLVAISGGRFQKSFIFPGETKGEQRWLTMGQGVSDIRCTAITYDKDGHVIGLMFAGHHPQEGEVSAYWQLKDGQWQGEKQDKIAFWKAFIQPTTDDKLKGTTVEFTKEKVFELSDLVDVSSGLFQKSFVFPGETKGEQRGHTMGQGVSDIRCTAITYDKEGQVVGLMFKGQHPKEGEVSAYWQLKDGQWLGEKQNKVASWKAFIQPTTDGSLKGRTVELFKEGAFELGDLVAVSKGGFQQSFVFPGETEGKPRSHTMGRGVSNIRCTAIKYDKEGQVVGLMFKGQHPKEGEVSAYWQLKDGQWHGEKQDKVASWKAFIQPTKDDSLKEKTVELSKEKSFDLDNLVFVSGGEFQRSFVFSGETKGRLRPHTMGKGVSDIRCTAITYNKQGQVV